MVSLKASSAGMFRGRAAPAAACLLPRLTAGLRDDATSRSAPNANSLFAFISFLVSFRAFFESLSVREAIHLHLPGWPRNSRIT